jgi:TPR repeat protein
MQLAAAHGNAEAECNLAILYQTGAGLSQSLNDALIWYEKAAEQGFAKAQHNLGALYGNGQGIPKDAVKAYKWLLLAQRSGYKDSQQELEWLKPQMTSQQVAQAQDLADEWTRIHSGR